MKVKEITLLSKKEYKEHKNIIPVINDCWWLKDPGDTDEMAACVSGNTLNEKGYWVNIGYKIRPALYLETEPVDSEFWSTSQSLIGSVIQYGKYNWTVLSACDNVLFVLCNTVVDACRFSYSDNNWEKSDVKWYLENDILKLILS